MRTCFFHGMSTLILVSGVNSLLISGQIIGTHYTRNNRNSVHSTAKPEPDNPDGGSTLWIKNQ